MDVLKFFLAWCWRQKFYLVFFCFVILIVWFQWFIPDHIIAGGDYAPPLNPWGLIQKALYAWLPDYFGIESFMSSTKIIPYYLFWGIFDLFGLSPFVIQRLWFIFLNLVGGIGVLYFFKYFLPNVKSTVAKLTGVSFYLFNLVVVTEFNHDTGLFGYYFFPLVAAALVVVLKERNLKSMAVFLLASTFLFSVASNPGVFVAAIAAAFLIFLIQLWDANPSDRKSILKFAGLLFGLFVLLNSFWIFTTLVPLFETQLASPFDASQGSLLTWDWVVEKSGRSSFWNLFLLLGKFSWYVTFAGESTFPYAPVYKEWFLILTTAFVPFMALASVIFYKKNKSYYKSLMIVLALFALLFLAKGAHEPFSDLFRFFFNNLPGFKVFREPYTKVIPFLPLFMACLLTITCQCLVHFFKNERWKLVLSYLLLFMINFSILFNSWPLLFGEQTWKSRINLAGTLAELPEYWLDAATYINDSKKSISNLYVSPPGNYYYNWEYAGHPIERRLIVAPMAQRSGVFPSLEKSFLLNQYERAFVEEDIDEFRYLSDWLRIDTVLHRNDIYWIWHSLFYSRFQNKDVVKNPWFYEAFFSNSGFFEEVKKIGDLDLFRRNGGPYDLVSIPDRVFYFTTDNPKSVLSYFNFQSFTKNDLVLLEKDLFSVDSKELDKIKSRVGTFVVSPVVGVERSQQNEFNMFLTNPAELKIPKSAKYRILVPEKGTLLNFDADSLKFVLKLAGDTERGSVNKNIIIDNAIKNDGYLELGSIELVEGGYQLKILANDKSLSSLSYDDLFFVYDSGQVSSVNHNLEYDKVNPTRFDFNMNLVDKKPFFLTLHQTYASRWKLNSSESDFEFPHFKSNLYANTWFIDSELDADANYSFVYSLQKYYVVFLLISASLIFVSLCIVLFKFIRR